MASKDVKVHDSARSKIVAGVNVLAIQGLNVGLTSSDFLLRATVEARSAAATAAQAAYLTTPTPGQPKK